LKGLFSAQVLAHLEEDTGTLIIDHFDLDFIADTLVPWASEWLFDYELWLATGEWYGGGIEHREGIDSRKPAKQTL
jgi:hypothetical protein